MDTFIFLFMFSGAILNTRLANLNTLILIVSSLIIIYVTLINKKNEFKLPFSTLDIIYLAFILFGIISSILNSSIQDFFAIIKYLLFYLVLVVCQRNYLTFDKFINSFQWVSIIIISLSFIQYFPSIYTRNYSGVYSNPNSLGIFVATTYAFFLGSLYKNVIQKSANFNKVFDLIMIVTSILVVSLTASRTAFFSIILITISLLFLTIIKYILKTLKVGISLKKILIYSIGFLALILLISLFIKSPLFSTIENNIIYKMNIRGGDITGSRNVLWDVYLRNSSLFGGRHDTLNVTLSVHNSFISMIYRFGWISGFFFVLFWIITFIKGIILYINSFKNHGNTAYVLLFVTLFILMGMMEIVTEMNIMYLALLSVGYLQGVNSNKSIH